MALLAALLVLAATWIHAVDAQGLPTGDIFPVAEDGRAKFRLEVTLSSGSPSCGPARPIILVNGLFQPNIHASSNDTVEITLINNLPKSLPSTSSGISLHFHGLYMWNEDVWSDGTTYLTQCPLPSGANWTYTFTASNGPGSYLWHDHSGVNRANGLQGAFILGMPRVTPPIPTPFMSHGEHTVLITDWYNQEANTMAMPLNRPYDADKATNDTGTYVGIGPPAALLINGQGNQDDCSDNMVHDIPEKGLYLPPVCNVTALTVPPSPGSAGCSHTTYDVTAGQHYRFRLINAGTAQYATVCFEAHWALLIAADSVPTEALNLTNGCVDLNSGQRYDVNLTASQTPGLYWIAVHTQYAYGSPSAYAVLRVGGSPAVSGSAAPGAGAAGTYAVGAQAGSPVDVSGVDPLLPPSPTPQGTMLPWTLEQENSVATSDFILGYNDNYDYLGYWGLFGHGTRQYDTGILAWEAVPGKVVTLNTTQPLLENGMIRWAMNNIAMPSNPPCSCVMDAWAADPEWVANNAAPNDTLSQMTRSNALLQASTWTQSSPGSSPVYNGDVIPVIPVAGLHIIRLEKDWIVDVIINNLNNSDMNGDYRNVSRPWSMQHPIHLHGHHFWVLGRGYGVYAHTDHEAGLNYFNPVLRDTVTLPEGGWVYLRFRADNPGLWPLHCHMMWHSLMGQQLVFAEAMDHVPVRSHPGPPCPSECINNFAPFTKSWVDAHVDRTQYPVPGDKKKK